MNPGGDGEGGSISHVRMIKGDYQVLIMRMRRIYIGRNGVWRIHIHVDSKGARERVEAGGGRGAANPAPNLYMSSRRTEYMRNDQL